MTTKHVQYFLQVPSGRIFFGDGSLNSILQTITTYLRKCQNGFFFDTVFIPKEKVDQYITRFHHR